MKQHTDALQAINPVRLRLGVVLMLLWWVPFWLLSPYIANVLDTISVSTITMVIMIIQTIIGVIGMYIAGQQAATIIKATPKRQVLGKMWQIFRHGNVA